MEIAYDITSTSERIDSQWLFSSFGLQINI